MITAANHLDAEIGHRPAEQNAALDGLGNSSFHRGSVLLGDVTLGCTILVDVAATAVRRLVHVFMLAPSHCKQAEEIGRTLTDMHTDTRGAAVLKRIGCSHLVPVSHASLGKIETALNNCGLRASA